MLIRIGAVHNKKAIYITLALEGKHLTIGEGTM